MYCQLSTYKHETYLTECAFTDEGRLIIVFTTDYSAFFSLIDNSSTNGIMNSEKQPSETLRP